MADPVTVSDIEDWWAQSSAVECVAAIGSRLGLMEPTDEILREFYYWNLVFAKEAKISAEKVRLEFAKYQSKPHALTWDVCGRGSWCLKF
jgi:hypothetical protein